MAVILIGSLARGDYTAFSDADVVVVVERDCRRPMDRALDFLDPTLSTDLEPRVYTIDELKRMASAGSRLVREILSYGRLLAGNPSVIEELKRAYGRSSPASRQL